MQPSCSPPPVAIRKDDHQPRGGEKQAGLRLPPQPQLQGCSSSSPGRGASQVRALPYAWLMTRFFLQHSEGKGVCQPCGGGRPRLRGAGWLQAVSCSVPDPLGWMASVPPPMLPPAALAGAWLSVHRTGDGCAVCGSGTSTPSPAHRPHWGDRTRRCMPQW
jgi:hypothetical protein